MKALVKIRYAYLAWHSSQVVTEVSKDVQEGFITAEAELIERLAKENKWPKPYEVESAVSQGYATVTILK